MCSNMFKLVQNLFKCVQMCSNLFKTCSNGFKLVQNPFKCVQTCLNLFKTCSNVFKCVQTCSKPVQMCSNTLSNYISVNVELCPSQQVQVMLRQWLLFSSDIFKNFFVFIFLDFGPNWRSLLLLWLLHILISIPELACCHLW